ncbi:MAG: tRNA (guanosine(37)-N1)-methyltransferase TrmD [Atribacterota bacterium]|nr:tRNA (guanosine(37)-N1)-methyltransferase TrmD [Atribacterota bacterium]
MRIDILTLFPEVIRAYVGTSILKRAQEKKKVFLKVHHLRAFTLDRYRTVDDYPFGGGPGMVLKPEPILRAVRFIRSYTGSNPLVIVTSPQGKLLTQEKAWELSRKKHLLIVCGRYQGIDERVMVLTSAEEISIGDYVLSGGELPALVIVEATVRLLPGVLGDEESLELDSFSDGLLGPPQFTRPRVFQGVAVPEVLLSGNHVLIERWRKEKAMQKTKELRPDLWEKWQEQNKEGA